VGLENPKMARNFAKIAALAASMLLHIEKRDEEQGNYDPKG
jgi:hypothetical protein